MAKAAEKTEVEIKKDVNQVPAFAQGQKKAKIGNVDSTDLIMPRIKLLAATSPEVTTFDDAKAGKFWHTIMSKNLGDKLTGVPIVVRKSIVLWDPNRSNQTPLARSNDCVHWDNPNMEFTVKHPKSPHAITYKTGADVASSGLMEFGTSIPGDSNSAPAASLTYSVMWMLPEMEELSPAIMIYTRSGVKPFKGLYSKIEARPMEHYGQIFDIGTILETKDGQPYYNVTFTANGYVQDEDRYNRYKALYEQFADKDWRANDERDESQEPGGAGGGKVEYTGGKKF